MLRTQQRALARAIVEPAGDEGAGALLGSSAARLSIYRTAYLRRLIDALRENYPVLARVLGDAAFEALAAAYVAAHPSRHPSIRWFGDRLAELIERQAELAPHPATADIARMEWALRGAFDAADAAHLEPQALAALAAEDWPSLRFDVHPSLRCVALRWSVEPVWSALHDLTDPLAEEPQLPPPAAHEHTLCVWRLGLATRWRSLSTAEAPLLQALRDGASFASLCGSAGAAHGDAAAEVVVAALRQWLADGLLSALRLP